MIAQPTHEPSRTTALGRPLQRCSPRKDYAGEPNDFDTGVQYFLDKFLAQNHQKNKDIYHHVTCAFVRSAVRRRDATAHLPPTAAALASCGGRPLRTASRAGLPPSVVVVVVAANPPANPLPP